VLFELGRVNECEQVTYEAFESLHIYPWLRERAGILAAAKGNAAAARVLWRSLVRDVVYGPRASERLRALDADSELRDDPDVQRLRSLRVTQDHPTSWRSVERMLTGLLEREPGNRMAFEYLMGHYLLLRRLDRFVQNLPRLYEFGDAELPRHYQEAILLYEQQTRRRFRIGQRSVEPGVREAFAAFGSAVATARAEGTPRALAPFADTYFYYYVLGPRE
jgi:hypothetical protein